MRERFESGMALLSVLMERVGNAAASMLDRQVPAHIIPFTIVIMTILFGIASIKGAC